MALENQASLGQDPLPQEGESLSSLMPGAGPSPSPTPETGEDQGDEAFLESPLSETEESEPSGQDEMDTMAETFSANPLLVTGGHKAYLSGYSGGLFLPEAYMTRAEVSKMLYNLLAAKKPVASSKFSDVDLEKWYGIPINSLAESGVLNGYKDGTFLPGATITRGEFVTALSKCFTMSAGTKSFSDTESHWAKAQISSAVAMGWINGYQDGKFYPNEPIRRCEAVKVMNVALGRKDSGFAADRDVQEFTDVPKTHWAFLEIAEAADPVNSEVEDPPITPSPSPSGSGDIKVGTSVRVTADSGLNMRSQPSTSASIITTLNRGVGLTVTDVSSFPWIGVKTAGGVSGYVHSDYVEVYTPNTNASGASLSASSLSMKQYQTLRLDGSVSSGLDAMRWTSSDPNVAVVGYTMQYNGGEEGAMIYGKSPGTATITFSNGGNVKASCTVTVGSPEAVRFAYGDQNTVAPGAKFRLIAVTDTARTGVKFQITDGPAPGTYETTTYEMESRKSSYGLPTNTVRVFSREVSFAAAGVYTLRAYSKGSGSYSSDYREFTVFVSSSNAGSTATSFETRRASTEMLKVIANFEGSVPEIEDDVLAPKHPTVGYGYVVPVNRTFYNTLTSTELYALLADKVNNDGYTSAVNNFRSKYNLKMSQAQFDALVSFVYNCGSGTLDASQYYAAASMTNAAAPPADLSESKPYSGVLNVGSATLRADASLTATAYGTVPNGATVSVIGVKAISSSKQVWYRAKYGTQTGWLPAGSVRLTASGIVRDMAYADSTIVADNLMQWHKAGSTCYPGLLWRRLAECKIFFYGNYSEAYHSNSNYQKNTYGFNYPSCEKKYQ